MRSVLFALFLVSAAIATAQEAPIGFTPEAVVWNDGPPTLPTGSFLDSATGTVTLTQDLRNILVYQALKHPIRLRVYVEEQRTERSSHVAGMSDWIGFK